MARITKEQLTQAIARYIRAWESMGVTLVIHLQSGDRANGIAYRIRDNQGNNAPGTSDGYLGMTPGEAWVTLNNISRTLEDLNQIRMVQDERE